MDYGSEYIGFNVHLALRGYLHARWIKIDSKIFISDWKLEFPLQVKEQYFDLLIRKLAFFLSPYGFRVYWINFGSQRSRMAFKSNI